MFHIDGQAPEAPEERYAGYGLRSARQAYRHKYATVNYTIKCNSLVKKESSYSSQW